MHHLSASFSHADNPATAPKMPTSQGQANGQFSLKSRRFSLFNGEMRGEARLRQNQEAGSFDGRGMGGAWWKKWRSRRARL